MNKSKEISSYPKILNDIIKKFINIKIVENLIEILNFQTMIKFIMNLMYSFQKINDLK